MNDIMSSVKNSLPNNGAQRVVAAMAAIAFSLAGFALGQVYAANRERGELAVKVENNAESVRDLRADVRDLLGALTETNQQLATLIGRIGGQ